MAQDKVLVLLQQKFPPANYTVEEISWEKYRDAENFTDDKRRIRNLGVEWGIDAEFAYLLCATNSSRVLKPQPYLDPFRPPLKRG